jgi:hypothetical protein
MVPEICPKAAKQYYNIAHKTRRHKVKEYQSGGNICLKILNINDSVC